MKLGQIVVHMDNYNFTKFHQNQMKNEKVLLIAHFSVQNFKVSVELWKSYIVASSAFSIHRRRFVWQMNSEWCTVVACRHSKKTEHFVIWPKRSRCIFFCSQFFSYTENTSIYYWESIYLVGGSSNFPDRFFTAREYNQVWHWITLYFSY